jgi:hypothetical protein
VLPRCPDKRLYVHIDSSVDQHIARKLDGSAFAAGSALGLRNRLEILDMRKTQDPADHFATGEAD